MARRIKICVVMAGLLFVSSIAMSEEVATKSQAEVSSKIAGEVERGDPYKDDLVDVKSDPKVGFEIAIKDKDLRFAAILVGGYAPYREVPGLDEKAKTNRLEEKYGTKIIADVSGDVIDEEWHRRQALKEPAEKYAKEYNQLLLEKIRLEDK